MDLEKCLRKENEQIGIWIEKIHSDINHYGKKVGNQALSCGSSHGVLQYHINRKYVPVKDIGKAEAIAQIEYEEELLSKLLKMRNAVEILLCNFETESIDSVYSSLCEGRRRLVKPIMEPEDAFIRNWISEKYEPNGYWEDNKTEYYTRLGERVRSKAEKIIADELTAYNVPYHYEYPLVVMDGSQQKILRPDFKALNRRTRDEFYIEHLGMMDKAGYNNANLNKLDFLERNGFLLGVNLLVFHETAENPLSISVVRRYIEEYLI